MHILCPKSWKELGKDKSSLMHEGVAKSACKQGRSKSLLVTTKNLWAALRATGALSDLFAFASTDYL